VIAATNRTWRWRWRGANSGRTSTTGSMWWRSGCPRCGSGARDSAPDVVLSGPVQRAVRAQEAAVAETLARLRSTVVGQRRELENAIRRMVVLTDGEQAFQASLGRRRNGPAATAAAPHPPSPRACGRSRAARARSERTALAEVLDRVHWNRAEAARSSRSATRRCSTRSPSASWFHRRVGTFGSDFRPTRQLAVEAPTARLTASYATRKRFHRLCKSLPVVRSCRQCRLEIQPLLLDFLGQPRSAAMAISFRSCILFARGGILRKRFMPRSRYSSPRSAFRPKLSRLAGMPRSSRTLP